MKDALFCADATLCLNQDIPEGGDFGAYSRLHATEFDQ
jgi:hypothetical protein